MDPAEGTACLIIAVPAGSSDGRGSCSVAVVVVTPLDWTALAAAEEPVSQGCEEVCLGAETW